MLRGITALQFQELLAVESFAEEHMDLRFALLASVIAGSLGAKTMDGQPYTPQSFLSRLHPELGVVETAPQPAARIIGRLDAWMNGSNAALREKQRGRA